MSQQAVSTAALVKGFAATAFRILIVIASIARGSMPIKAGARYASITRIAVRWSSPLQIGVHDTSPSPVIPSSVRTLTITKNDSRCAPAPPRTARLGLIGMPTGIVSMPVIVIAGFVQLLARIQQMRQPPLQSPQLATTHRFEPCQDR